MKKVIFFTYLTSFLLTASNASQIDPLGTCYEQITSLYKLPHNFLYDVLSNYKNKKEIKVFLAH